MFLPNLRTPPNFFLDSNGGDSFRRSFGGIPACDPLFPQKLFSVNHPFPGGSHAQRCNNDWKMNSQVCIPMEQEPGQVLGGLSTDQDCVQSRGRGCAGHGATDVQCSQLYSSLYVVVAQRACGMSLKCIVLICQQR